MSITRATVLFVLFFLIKVKASAQTDSTYFELPHRHKNMTVMDKALLTVAELPEVKEWFAAHKAAKPALDIAGAPTKGQPQYWIRVGICNMDMFRTAYHFYVDVKTWRVSIWDQLCEDDRNSISLEQWRYWRNTPGYNKLHVYRHGKLVVTEQHYKRKSNKPPKTSH